MIDFLGLTFKLVRMGPHWQLTHDRVPLVLVKDLGGKRETEDYVTTQLKKIVGEDDKLLKAAIDRTKADRDDPSTWRVR